MRRQISLVAALALSASIAVAGTNKEITLTETKWKMIGNPGDGYLHSGVSSSSSYAAKLDSALKAGAGTGNMVTLNDSNDADTNSVALYPTYSSAQGADVTLYGKPGELETQLDSQYGAGDYNLTIRFELVAGSGGSQPNYMYVEANSSDPNQPWIGRITFTNQYVGRPFNLEWGEATAGTYGSNSNDYNASYVFEAGATIYLTALADSSAGGGSGAAYSQNRLWLDIELNATDSTHDEINTTIADVNLTIMSFRNGQWSMFDMNTSSTGGGAIDMEVLLSDTIFTGYSETDYNNTKKGAAYWYKEEDNLSNNIVQVLINDGGVTASDLDSVMFDDSTNLGDSAWNLVAFPTGRILNAQTGLVIDSNQFGDMRIGGLYGETVNLPLDSMAFSVAGSSDYEMNVTAFNQLMKTAESNGSFSGKIIAYRGVFLGTGDAQDDMLILGDSDFNLSIGGAGNVRSIGGKALAIDERTPYGEQALAIHLNKDLIDGNQKAMSLVLSIPSISKDIDINITSGPGNWTPSVALEDWASGFFGQIISNSGGALTDGDINGTMFDANFDGFYDDVLIAFASPTNRTTLSSDAFARFSIYENTYVKTYFNDINSTYDDGNLTIAYIAGSDRNTTIGVRGLTTADINISTKGTVGGTLHGSTALNGISAMDWDVYTSDDGNFTTIISNSPYMDIVEVNNSTDFLMDLAFDSNFDAATDRSYTAYTDLNGSYPAGTDSNVTTGFVSYAWTLDQLVDRFTDTSSGALNDGDVYASGNYATNDLRLLPVWSASPLSINTNDIFSILQSMTTPHRIEEIWSYKDDSYKLWYNTDLTTLPSEWVGKGSNLFTSRAGDGFWLKTKRGESFSMTAGSFNGETGIKTTTHFDNENDVTYNYIFRENILNAPTSTFLDTFSSADGNVTNLPFVMTLKRGSNYEGGLYISTAGSTGYQFNINPYTFKFASDQVSLSANENTDLYFYDGISSPVSNTISITAKTRPTTPTVSIDSSYAITTSNIATSSDETVVGSEKTLGFDGTINEANLSANNLSTTVLTNLSTNGKFQPLDILDNESSTPRLYTYKFVTRKTINYEGGYSHFLYSDMSTIRFIPIFGARIDNEGTSISSLTDLNQTRPIIYDSNGSTAKTEGGEDLYSVYAIMTHIAGASTSAVADKFDQNGTLINDGSRYPNLTNINTANALTLQSSGITTGGVSLSYRPMVASSGSNPFTSKLVVGGTSTLGYTDGTVIAQVGTVKEYEGSRFYLYYNNNDTNVSVYYGDFDYQDGNNTVYVPLTRITGITNESDTATVLPAAADVPCFSTTAKTAVCAQ